MLEVIKLFVRRMLMGKGKGILQIPPQKAVDDFANDLFKKFKQNGVSDEAVTNPNDVKAIWNQITNREAQIFTNNLKDALQKPDPFKKAGEVFDLKGKKIKNPQNIMGGEEIIETDAEILARLKKVNKESLSNMRYEAHIKVEEAKAAADEDYIMKIFDPEDFATGGRAGLYRGGQAEIEPSLSDIGHGSDALMARNALLTPGSQATTSTGLNYLLGEDNDTTRVPYGEAGPVTQQELDNYLKDRKQRDKEMGKEKFLEDFKKWKKYQNKDLDYAAEGGIMGYKHGDMVLPKEKPINEYLLKQVLSQAGANTLDPKTREMFIQMYKKKIREKNSKAEGGRIGYVKGKLVKGAVDKGRRGFMKAAGVTTAGIAALKTGLLGFGKEAAPVVEKAAEAVSNTASQVPPYFLNLVKKIKNLGDDAPRLATLDRQKVTTYKDYTLTEDVATGRQEIQRMKVSDDGNSADYYGQPLTEETYMSYTPGEEIFQETAKGKTKITKTKPEYEEGTAYLRSDRGNAGDVVDESATISDDVIEEGTPAVDNLSEFGKAEGGRIGFGKGDLVTKGIPFVLKEIRALLKNKKKVKQAVDDIYPTGDYKYDAEMAADALVENNPKTFKGLLREDLDDLTRSEVYGAVLGPIQNNALMVSRMKKATKPTKTLEGIEKTGTIDISNPGIADEFTRFMKETNPKDYKNLEEKVILESFDPKGKKGHATGGRVSLSGGGLAGMLGE